jgi:hypothetical protein
MHAASRPHTAPPQARSRRGERTPSPSPPMPPPGLAAYARSSSCLQTRTARGPAATTLATIPVDLTASAPPTSGRITSSRCSPRFSRTHACLEVPWRRRAIVCYCATGKVHSRSGEARVLGADSRRRRPARRGGSAPARASGSLDASALTMRARARWRRRRAGAGRAAIAGVLLELLRRLLP